MVDESNISNIKVPVSPARRKAATGETYSLSMRGAVRFGKARRTGRRRDRCGLTGTSRRSGPTLDRFQGARVLTSSAVAGPAANRAMGGYQP